MSKSRKVGPFRIRPEPYLYKGQDKTKWRLEIPASLTANGKRKKKLFDNCKQALTVARELRKRIDPVTGQLRIHEKPNSITLTQAIHSWKTDETLRVETLKKRSSTLEIDLHRTKALTAYFGNYDLRAITERSITAYQSSRLKAGRKPVTINSEVALLTRILRWAKKQGHITEIPEIEQIPVQLIKVDIPTPQEVVRILSALPKRLRPIIQFLAETGCRVGEARNLTWDCVDEVGGYVEIHSREGWTPKTRQSERRIPLNPPLLQMIRELPKKGPFVFPGPDPEKPIGNFRKAFIAAVDKADIKRNGRRITLSPKVLRKAHATWQAERGVSESLLQDLLGHARGSRITKQHYIHNTEEAKKAAVIQLPIGEHRAN